ncbi:hypothetical protein KDA_40620 [Dictyobacter alpinus]|uniref:Uncharacterized protein n=2 Tax=Dictyobacter alpinus TaxID=2014873 RepID=A0A402BAX3_9CHLR|nr:hypothetical protein KDA_40620 [Dictyobacter alpinus]
MLLAQLQAEGSMFEEERAPIERVTLNLSDAVSVGMVGMDVPILRQSLFSAQGCIEVLASSSGELLEFRYNRLSGSGEEYHTRLFVHGATL